MRLEEYISEAISSGRRKERYMQPEDINSNDLRVMNLGEITELLKNMEGGDVVRLDPSKMDYKYDITKMHGYYEEVEFLHKYVKEHHKSGQVVWHIFGRSGDLVVVNLNPDTYSRTLSSVFLMHYNRNGVIRTAGTYREVPTIGSATILDGHGGTFDSTFQELSYCLSNTL